MALGVPSLPITVGVGAFVIRDGGLLVVRRTYGPSKGLWTIPSGYVEPHDSVAQAVEREVREETAVAARAEAIVGVRNRVTATALVGVRGMRLDAYAPPRDVSGTLAYLLYL